MDEVVQISSNPLNRPEKREQTSNFLLCAGYHRGIHDS